uniref:Uncharacterized protein n=1 Tax=Anguilla anguilla TaxID=7936 RepID=A0A0E9RNN5_ANGAN
MDTCMYTALSRAEKDTEWGWGKADGCRVSVVMIKYNGVGHG